MLFKAAVEKIGEIEKTGTGWEWTGWKVYTGKTPEEAVTRLFIALNKKNGTK